MNRSQPADSSRQFLSHGLLIAFLAAVCLLSGCSTSQVGFGNTAATASTSGALLTIAPLHPHADETVTFQVGGRIAPPGSIVVIDRAEGTIAWGSVVNFPGATASTSLRAGDYLVVAISGEGRTIVATAHLLVGDAPPATAHLTPSDRVTSASGWSVDIRFVSGSLQAGRTAIASFSFNSTNGKPLPDYSIDAPGFITYDASGDYLSVGHRVARQSSTATSISHVDESSAMPSEHGETVIHFDFPHKGPFTIVSNARIGGQVVPLRFAVDVQ